MIEWMNTKMKERIQYESIGTVEKRERDEEKREGEREGFGAKLI